jgi:hypothetical protein
MAPTVGCPYYQAMSVAEQIVALVKRRPSLTEAEIRDALIMVGAHQQSVASTCIGLLRTGQIAREGTGAPLDPFRYHLTRSPDA